MKKLNRRDFLKLAGTISASVAWRRVFPVSTIKPNDEGSLQNVIIILFDTMSAKNLSLYGYPRRTTPNLERFADRATVYHSHYSAGNYTVPGTASFLTGMYPWTHRALNQSGLIKRDYAPRNFFNLFGSAYHRVAFSQNIWANFFLNQFEQDIDFHLPPSSFSDASLVVGENFEKDHNSAFRAFDNSLLSAENTPSSLIFGIAERLMFTRRLNRAQGKDYPRGLPGLVDYPLYFRLGTVFSGLISECQKLESPYLAYFHLWSPHEPYRPHVKFINDFRDDLQFIAKTPHPLGDQISQKSLDRQRLRYDQYIANVDFEFGRLLDHLQEAGILDRSYVIVTSDHGQMIERGVHGHVTPLLYEPVINIPLLISAPGQASRKDIYSPSVNIDI
jgi:membrane-anchored protein YejM (alkaline phosphatase superfamily)